MRVVYLDHVAQLSGAELALLRTIKALPGVDAHVILAEDGQLVQRMLQAGISIEVLPMHERTRQLRKHAVRLSQLSPLSLVDTVTYTLRLAYHLRRLKPDIVHTNTLKAGIYGSIAGRLAGRPVVWHLRDRVHADYLPRFAVTLLRAFTRYVPHVVISNSEATRETLRRREGTVVIPSVVESISASPKQPNRSDPLVVGIVGRLAPWKGQDVFLRAFARAFADGPQRAVVVGAPLFGHEELEYAEHLRETVSELRIQDRVDFRGHREDIESELRGIDILVHAATLPEPFGQVVVEGMAARLPVVASHAGGPQEIITDGVDGILYPPGNVPALAGILAKLDADPQLRLALGNAAATRARDFSPAVVTSQILDAYGLAIRLARGSRISS